jgi:hypothetical protein
METQKDCKGCDFEPVRPNAQFMFTVVEKCVNCGNIKRQDGEEVEHIGLPTQVQELVEE